MEIVQNLRRTDAHYIMQGNAIKKTLDIYHLILAPTFECNLRCKHCYLEKRDMPLMSRKTALRLVDEFDELVQKERGRYGGIFHVKGGEPFVAPYLWDIADKLAELKSLHFMLTTNGTFGNEEVYEKLSGYSEALDGYLTVIVSIEGASEKTDSILRGNEHFDKAIEFIDGLRRHGVNFHLNCVVHNGNIDELEDYVEFAQEYGASQVNFLKFIPKGRGSSIQNLAVSTQEYYDKINEIYQNSNPDTKQLFTGSLPDIVDSARCGNCSPSNECVAAYKGLFYITPDGSVFTCPNVTFEKYAIGNVNQKSIQKLSDNLLDLYGQIKSHSNPFVCVGEKIMYEKTDNTTSIHSPNRLVQKTAKVIDSETKSYCFCRNW